MLRRSHALLLVTSLPSIAGDGPFNAKAVSSVRKWELPLRTRGAHIIDALGRPVRLACANWYGAHLEQMVMNGLDKQRLSSIVEKIAKLGLNCIRLPFSLDMVFSNATTVPHPSRSLVANPELKDKSPLEIFDSVVNALTTGGILVILNNHVSSSGWCCSVIDGEGLWYTRLYDELAWLDGLELMAARYKDNGLVVGFDLRNEIRNSELGVPTWGGGDPKTDWAIAARKGSHRVMSVNVNMLLIISGHDYCTLLCDIPTSPLHLELAFRGRIVYTAHEYSWTNYHLSARSYILSQVMVLHSAILCCILLLAFFALHYLLRTCFVHRYHQLCDHRATTPPPDRDSYAVLTPIQAPSMCHFMPALLSTGVSLGCAVVWYAASHQCGMSRLLIEMVARVLTFMLGLPSLILWMRLFVVYLLSDRRQALDDDPELSVPQSFAWISPISSYKCLACVVVLIEIFLLYWITYTYGTYETFAEELDRRWVFLAYGGDVNEQSAYVAPIWIGEFGANESSLWWSYLGTA